MLAIIIMAILLIIIWLFVAPITFSIDSEKKELLFEYSYIFRFRVTIVDFEPIFTIELPFKVINLRKIASKRGKKKLKKKHREKEKKRFTLSVSEIYQLGKAGLLFIKKSMAKLKIIKAELYLDTGNYHLNAMLIPVLSSLESRKISTAINFVGFNRLFVKLQYRAVYILWQALILAFKFIYIKFLRRK